MKAFSLALSLLLVAPLRTNAATELVYEDPLKSSFKDKLIGRYFRNRIANQMLFGIEVEVTTHLTREQVGARLVKILGGRSRYDRKKKAVVDSPIGKISFQEEENATEFVTEPLTWKQAQVFARVLDALGWDGHIKGTKGSDSAVGMHVNVGIHLGKDSPKLVRNLVLNYEDHADLIRADDPPADNRKEYLGRYDSVSLHWLRTVTRPTFEKMEKHWKDRNNHFRDVSVDHVFSDEAPENRLEFRYPNTVLGNADHPEAASRHLLRELKFITALVWVSKQGRLQKDGQIIPAPYKEKWWDSEKRSTLRDPLREWQKGLERIENMNLALGKKDGLMYLIRVPSGQVALGPFSSATLADDQQSLVATEPGKKKPSLVSLRLRRTIARGFDDYFMMPSHDGPKVIAKKGKRGHLVDVHRGWVTKEGYETFAQTDAGWVVGRNGLSHLLDRATGDASEGFEKFQPIEETQMLRIGTAGAYRLAVGGHLLPLSFDAVEKVVGTRLVLTRTGQHLALRNAKGEIITSDIAKIKAIERNGQKNGWVGVTDRDHNKIVNEQGKWIGVRMPSLDVIWLEGLKPKPYVLGGTSFPYLTDMDGNRISLEPYPETPFHISRESQHVTHFLVDVPGKKIVSKPFVSIDPTAEQGVFSIRNPGSGETLDLRTLMKGKKLYLPNQRVSASYGSQQGYRNAIKKIALQANGENTMQERTRPVLRLPR